MGDITPVLQVQTISIFIRIQLHKIEQVTADWSIKKRIVIHSKIPSDTKRIEDIKELQAVETTQVRIPDPESVKATPFG